MSLENISTNRLVLIPINLEITRSLLDGNRQDMEKIGITADEKWPTTDTLDLLPVINKSLEKDTIPSGFETWMIAKKENMQVIGDIGFHGKPNEQGEVEVGFGLVEQERGKGFGFESLKAIIEWLRFQESVKTVKADCLISNKASARILEKAGMKEINRDHDMIYWEFVK